MAGEEYLGQLVGNHSVESNGSFVYRVPLQLPPGINDVRPNLSLAYNSTGDNGLLGIGWSISGLSVIQRCKASYVRDGFRSGVNDGQDYRYCMDGKRLVEVAPNEYRTERESFAHIFYNGTHWEVKYPSGFISYFGTQANSRIDTQVWHLDKHADLWGNFYSVHYESDIENSIRPSQIEYTISALTPQAEYSIDFNYESRNDAIYKRFGSLHTKMNERLASITVNFSGSTQWEYRLEYQEDGESYFGKTYNDPVQLSRLWQVNRCFLNDQDCQAPLQFDWSERTQGQYYIKQWTRPPPRR